MRKVSDYIALMAHAIGKQTPAAGHDLYATFNDAGRRLFSANNWTWLSKGPVSIPVVANQDYIDLPVDFDSVENVWVPNTGLFTTIEVISRGELAALRSNAVVTIIGGSLKICFDANVPGARPGQSRALLYPIPTTDASPVLQMIYSRSWVTVSSRDDDKELDIPEDIEDLLVLGARAAAWQRENGTNDFADIAMYAAEIQRIGANDFTQPSEGRMRGGAGDRRGAPLIKIGLATL